MTELVNGLVEGRYWIKNFGNDEMVMIELESVLVDCTPNEQGKPFRFDICHKYMPENFLEDLAIRLATNYEIDVSVVDSPEQFTSPTCLKI